MRPLQWTAALGIAVLLSACTGDPEPSATPSPSASGSYLDASAPVDARVADLLGRMTLEEKIGQMTQLEEGSVAPDDTARLLLGSVLHGGGGVGDRQYETWAQTVREHQEAAVNDTRLGIPILYGIDAVHGFGALHGGTVFPHQIGLGATNDPELLRRIGQATALETTATGIRWNFSPVLAIPDDIRWGRTYEAYSQDPERVTALGVAYIEGLMGPDLTAATSMLPTPKHFIGDGQAEFGTSSQVIITPFLIDQGIAPADEALLRETLLPPYQAAIDAGALAVMPSYTSWGDQKVHGQPYLLTDVLRGDVGFEGFVISDWAGCDQIDPGDYDSAIATCVNAGVDMVMVPQNGERFQDALSAAVADGTVSQERIDEAVARILTVKFTMGLFEDPFATGAGAEHVGSAEHRALAREAVAASQVLLANNGVLPLSADVGSIAVFGNAAHDMGIQAGGWTQSWQGDPGPVIPGTTIREGIEQAVGDSVALTFSAPESGSVDVCIVVAGERPYAEGVGDSSNLELDALSALDGLEDRCNATVLVLVTGRPMIITDVLDDVDAVVAAWLPGTAGEGVADVLFGVTPFTGTLPMNWPRDITQVPLGAEPDEYLFPIGHGLQ